MFYYYFYKISFLLLFDYYFYNISCFFVLLLFPRDKFFFFLASNLNSSRRSHVDLLFINEEQEKVGTSDVHDSFATNADRVYDVTDTECWAQNGSTLGRVYAPFECPFFKF